MRKGLQICSVVILILSLASGVRADDRLAVHSEEMTIILDRPHLAWAEHLERIYARTKEELENTIGWKLLSKPTIVLVGDEKVFESMSDSPYVAAYAVPERHLIVMDLSRLNSEPYLFNVTFKHELCHLILHDHIKDSLLPRWLDEGVCQWVSGSLGEILLSGGMNSAVQVDLSRHAVPLDRLAQTFPSGKYPLLLAYQESRSFVEFLSGRYGSKALLSILDHLKQGEGIHQAVLNSLSKPFASVEEEWLEDIRDKNVWLIWVSQYFYELLFVAGALLTVVAFIKLMFRKRRYMEEADEDGDGNEQA